MRAVDATAPVRLDLVGGTLDIWPLYLALPAPVVTVNVALDLPSRVRVETAGGSGAGIRLLSRDRGEEAAFPTRAALEAALDAGDAPLALLAHAVRAVGPAGGFTLETASASPPGAGLGASSSLLVATLAALARAAGADASADVGRLVPLARDVEAAALRGPTGYQDYYPAVLGGCLALEGRPGGVAVERLAVDLDALARRLRLVYTGAPHVSVLTNWEVLKAFFDREAQTVRALEEIAAIARSACARLRAGDLSGALEGVVAEGTVRRRLAPGVVTESSEALDAAVRDAGAWGTKILGAGGGGSVLVVLADEEDDGVDRVLARGPWRALPVRLTAQGLRLEPS